MLFILEFIVLFLSLSLIKPVTNYLNQSYCQCNTETIKGRIYKGTNASADELNFAAILYFKERDYNRGQNYYFYENFCTAVLINPLWLITAGHCFTGFRTGIGFQNYAALGSDRDPYKIFFNSRYFREIVEKIPHPESVLNSSINDFGLIKVASAFELGKSTNIFAACLDLKGRANLNLELLTAGYGAVKYRTAPKKRSEPVTEQYTLTIFTRGLMKMTLKKTYTNAIFKGKRYACFQDNIICAIGDGESSLCGGDSGGPLMAINTYTQTQHLIGIVSSGIPKPIGKEKKIVCGPTKRMYFSEIKPAINWIKNYTGEDICVNEHPVVDC